MQTSWICYSMLWKLFILFRNITWHILLYSNSSTPRCWWCLHMETRLSVLVVVYIFFILDHDISSIRWPEKFKAWEFLLKHGFLFSWSLRLEMAEYTVFVPSWTRLLWVLLLEKDLNHSLHVHYGIVQDGATCIGSLLASFVGSGAETLRWNLARILHSVRFLIWILHRFHLQIQWCSFRVHHSHLVGDQWEEVQDLLMHLDWAPS